MTGPLNAAALLMEKGTVYAGADAGSLVNLGSVRKVKFMGKQVHTKIDSDNNGTIVNKLRLNGEIEMDWLEPGSISNIELLFKGAVTKTSTAASPVSTTGEVTASGSWAYNKFIPFVVQSGTNAKPTSVTITAGTDGLLVNVTDYDLIQDPGTLYWGYMVKDSSTVTTQSQSLTAVYTCTPSASLTLTGGNSLTMTNRYVKIIGPLDTDSTKTRVIILTSAVVTSDMLLPFTDVETANDVGVMPVKFENNKGATWTVTDSVNPN